MKNLTRNSAKERHGFTLIELLIVVAIIAILAAIAVPNFLEAQTRAKNARVKADMRTIATAMETYSVDYNRPPIGYYELRMYDGKGAPFYLGIGHEFGQAHAWSRVTTPLAYLTTPPKSPWQMQEFVDQNRLQPRWWYSDKYYLFETCVTSTPALGIDAVEMGRFRNPKSKGVTWVARSFGPARRWVWPDHDGNWRNNSLLPALFKGYVSITY